MIFIPNIPFLCGTCKVARSSDVICCYGLEMKWESLLYIRTTFFTASCEKYFLFKAKFYASALLVPFGLHSLTVINRQEKYLRFNDLTTPNALFSGIKQCTFRAWIIKSRHKWIITLAITFFTCFGCCFVNQSVKKRIFCIPAMALCTYLLQSFHHYFVGVFSLTLHPSAVCYMFMTLLLL